MVGLTPLYPHIEFHHYHPPYSGKEDQILFYHCDVIEAYCCNINSVLRIQRAFINLTNL